MLNLRHGGRINEQSAVDTGSTEVSSRSVHDKDSRHKGAPRPKDTPFGYLFQSITKDPESHLPADDPAKVVSDLQALGKAMTEEAPADPNRPDPLAPPGNSAIPAGYTYWGQFVDHDLTANTDRDSRVSDIRKADLRPLPPSFVVENLRNLRQPTLNLDSVYGEGPSLIDRHSADAGFYDGLRFRLGTATDDGDPIIRGERIPPVEDLDRDLPRIGVLLDAGVITRDIFTEEQLNDPSFLTRPYIGDTRNDENLIVAQLHVAFLRFHNQVVQHIDANRERFKIPRRHNEALIFERANQLVRFHYQWLTVHDWLKTVTSNGVVDNILLGGPKHYARRDHQSYMPIEFSVAGFRFGHTLVRGAYDFNRNFGKKNGGDGNVRPVAPFDLLFLFTGNGFLRDPNDPTKLTHKPFNGKPTLPFNWIIEWDRLVDKGSSDPAHFTRKVDAQLVPPLLDMVNEGSSPPLPPDTSLPIRQMLRSLAQRNLLRGYLLSLPTGQAVSRALGTKPLSRDELLQNNPAAVSAALEQGGFLQRTPLWFYLLKESEVRANGNTLGETGSRLVAETIIGLLVNDRDSYLNEHGGWDPSQGVRLPNGDLIVTIRDFLRFAGVHPE